MDTHLISNRGANSGPDMNPGQRMIKKRWMRRVLLVALGTACLMLTGCNANVGVGMSVGVPIGNHGYMSVGTGNWF